MENNEVKVPIEAQAPAQPQAEAVVTTPAPVQECCKEKEKKSFGRKVWGFTKRVIIPAGVGGAVVYLAFTDKGRGLTKHVAGTIGAGAKRLFSRRKKSNCSCCETGVEQPQREFSRQERHERPWQNKNQN